VLDQLDELDTKEMEKFELLSAYLDGEVTVAERKQVEQWLQEDAAFKAMHQNMRRMHGAMEKIPAPATAPIGEFADGVFAKINHRRRNNWLKAIGGTCAAALLAVGGTVAASWNNLTTPSIPQLAKISLPAPGANSLELAPEPIMVSLNAPIVQITPAKAKDTKSQSSNLDILDILDEEI
jgi:predicted anti-sigma-YlaC factor YlaD